MAEREYQRWITHSQVDKPPCRAAGDSIVGVDGADVPLTLSSRRKGSRLGFSGLRLARCCPRMPEPASRNGLTALVAHPESLRLWTHPKGSLTFSAFVLRCEESLVVWELLGSISAFVMEPLSVGLEGIGERLKG